MNRSVPVGEVRLLGDRALLLGVDDALAGQEAVRAVRAGLQAAGAGLRCEVIGGRATVMVLTLHGEVERVRQIVADMARSLGHAVPGGEVGGLLTVPCTFDGPDLFEVSRQSGCPPHEVVALLTGQPLTVSVVGFSPGFAFLTGLAEPLRRVNRRPHPRPVVAPGSVALADGQAAVYPTASPGGWQLVGRTGVALFSLAAPYARLATGDRVQFTVAGPDDRPEPAPLRLPAWVPPPGARHLLDVVQPGLCTVRQDGGRRDVAAIGVPSAGPADPVACALANLLVGNVEVAGTLEVTAHGPVLRARATGYVAVVGGAPDIRLQGRTLESGRVFPIATGQELAIGVVRGGFRTYVAVAGGVLGPEIFGSCASDQLSGLGAGALVAGEALFAGPMSPPLGDHLGAPVEQARTADGSLVVRVLPGPHAEWFEPDALERLAEARFSVQGESNRVGLRLAAEGETLALRTAGGLTRELDSQGMVHGAVQVPPDGQPVVLLPDHATLGGYPVVAVVATVDLGVLGQCAPGDRVALRPIDLATARRLAGAQRRARAGAVVGHYPVAVE